jgi:putative folate metabolism gamma-glutamate ligase
MKVTAYKTHKINPDDKLTDIFNKYLPSLEEKSIVAIASKIVGICEGRVVKIISEEKKDEQKTALAKKEANYYLPRKFNQYGFMITINRGIMVASAGIDESNSDGFFSLWPEDPQKSANQIREYLIKKHNLKHLGIILTDSKLTPLRWGVTGVAIAHSGFEALNSYIGKPDIYGKLMHAEQANISDSLATAAVAEMGEGAEQQPIAVISNVSFVKFLDRNPTQAELDALKIDLEDDVYASLLNAVDWEKGGNTS